MKQLEVQIMGQNYLLSCPENSETQLFEAVSKVDTAMCKIRDAGKVKARDRIAVLAAINLAFQVQELAPPEVPAQVPEQLSTMPDPGIEASQSQLANLLQRLDTALATETPTQ